MKNCFKFINKYWKPLFVVLWFVLVMSCFFIWGYIEVHAAADQDYFPIEQNKNGHFTDNAISAIANYFDDETNYIVVYYFDYNYRAIVFPKSTYTNDLGQLCGEKNSALTHFSFYGLGVVPTSTYQFQLINGTQVVNLQNFGGGFNYWQNLPSSNYDTSKDYISNLKIWTTNNSSKKLVINYDEDPTYTDPDNDTYPNNFEKPNISDYYDTSNAPLFDGSSVENAVQSLYSLLKWYFQDPKGLSGLIQYVIDNTNWAIQKVINNIRNVIEDSVETISGFLSDIKDWVDDIKDGINDLVDFITNPWDSSEFQTQLSGSTFYGSLSSTITNIRTFGASLTQASEPQSFVISIDLTSIGWGSSEIDFNWFVGIRGVVRLIIGCILIYWLAITIITSINNIVGSGGDNEE